MRDHLLVINKMGPNAAVQTQMADVKLLVPDGSAKPLPPLVDKTLCGACDIVKLLPTGTVTVFHALAPSFSNHGACGVASRYLTLALVGACAPPPACCSPSATAWSAATAG